MFVRELRKSIITLVNENHQPSDQNEKQKKIFDKQKTHILLDRDNEFVTSRQQDIDKFLQMNCTFQKQASIY